jgi:hypothetical protein
MSAHSDLIAIALATIKQVETLGRGSETRVVDLVLEE